MRWAAQDRAGHCEWLPGSVRSWTLMMDVQHVTDDEFRPLKKEFLNKIVANAVNVGALYWFFIF